MVASDESNFLLRLPTMTLVSGGCEVGQFLLLNRWGVLYEMFAYLFAFRSPLLVIFCFSRNGSVSGGRVAPTVTPVCTGRKPYSNDSTSDRRHQTQSNLTGLSSSNPTNPNNHPTQLNDNQQQPNPSTNPTVL